VSKLPFRIGTGWDTHRMAPDRPLILGGITVPSDLGLDGHSDADILLHALTDALLGALALGDIGLHFPDTDPEWKNAESHRFLSHAVDLVHEHGYEVANADTTIILQRPKLRDFRPAIRENLARLLRVPLDAVSVKFKTAEGVGPVGERLSAEVQAVVLLSSRGE
jgi:2-C-methyl-D-erythritol 2,4-cyclodiphosphate synthase